MLTIGNSIIRPGFFMENFDGFIGAIAVSGMRAGLGKDTTINLVVSLIHTSDGSGPIVVRFPRDANSLKASEDIGRVAAGVLKVSFYVTGAMRNTSPN